MDKDTEEVFVIEEKKVVPDNVMGLLVFITLSPLWGLVLGFGWWCFKFAAGWS